MNKFSDQEIDAQLAHDIVEEKNAWHRAEANGCQYLVDGTRWLVVDVSGFLSPKARIRPTGHFFESSNAEWINSYGMLKRNREIKIGRYVVFNHSAMACNFHAENVQIGVEKGNLQDSLNGCINIQKNTITKIIKIKNYPVSKFGESGLIFGFFLNKKEYWAEQSSVHVK